MLDEAAGGTAGIEDGAAARSPSQRASGASGAFGGGVALSAARPTWR